MNTKKKICKIELNQDRILYHFNNGECEVKHFAHTLDELKDRPTKELVKLSRGVGESYQDINMPHGCIFIVNAVQENTSVVEGEDEIVGILWTKAVRSLHEAVELINPVDSMWRGASFTFKECSEGSFYSNDDDVYTYTAMDNGDLTFVVHCQFIGDRGELINSVLQIEEMNIKDFILHSAKERFIKNAQMFAKTNEIPFIDQRVY